MSVNFSGHLNNTISIKKPLGYEIWPLRLIYVILLYWALLSSMPWW